MGLESGFHPGGVGSSGMEDLHFSVFALWRRLLLLPVYYDNSIPRNINFWEWLVDDHSNGGRCGSTECRPVSNISPFPLSKSAEFFCDILAAEKEAYTRCRGRRRFHTKITVFSYFLGLLSFKGRCSSSHNWSQMALMGVSGWGALLLPFPH